MNHSAITYILGWILNFEAGFLLLPCMAAVIYKESAGWSFAPAIALCLLAGIPLALRGMKRKAFHAKEGLVAVALSWIVLSAVGAVPFVLSGAIPSPVDAFFETVSGFTTTGASILPTVEGLPRCILFWRSFTHWIGGMGVLVFILSFLPLTGGYHMNLMKAESPGPVVGKLVPKVRTTAKILYGIYVALTVVEIFLLLLGGMSVFDALTTAFGTAGTGGFGIKNDSIAGYSPYLQYIVTLFMILFGVNFNFYFLILIRRAGQLLRSEELWTYLGVIAVSIGAIMINLRGMYATAEETFRHAAFQVGSIITTTGFATTDFNQWPCFSQAILVLLMFIGACAGSTGGGIKVSRILLLLKSIQQEFHYYLHPRQVRCLRMEGHPVDSGTMRAVHVYLVLYVLLFSSSVLLVSLDGQDLVTTFTAVAAALNNIGPGLAEVGPTGNFSLFSDPAKLLLSFDMLAGRLELFPMLLLFFPRTWKRFG
ncbi:TrkH family potassium uptake protein [Pseudoflavonifractor sp. 524-17]|uniref:TrkH family potassium uptake protein n=1 Tax=Pseudoflavonifractor sp. 524-17 TaxID=2304577 RepID=UPI00137B69A1|nr:TrkH family potassium uptake protein [Pseudoflavonifractor sp. 524-17]NCE63944.1 TrkH family potassium uptake protein [Pseudoflavonifractor sp. 524-17]